jgi:hypothetical protein
MQGREMKKIREMEKMANLFLMDIIPKAGGIRKLHSESMYILKLWGFATCWMMY